MTILVLSAEPEIPGNLLGGSTTTCYNMVNVNLLLTQPGTTGQPDYPITGQTPQDATRTTFRLAAETRHRPTVVWAEGERVQFRGSYRIPDGTPFPTRGFSPRHGSGWTTGKGHPRGAGRLGTEASPDGRPVRPGTANHHPSPGLRQPADPQSAALIDANCTNIESRCPSIVIGRIPAPVAGTQKPSAR